MNKKLEKELRELAKKNGLEVFFCCSYCQEKTHSPTDEEHHFIVTFVKEGRDNE